MNNIRERIRAIFQLNDPPYKLAAAFALGVFVAFSPTIGLHVITCLVFAWIFRLSKLVIVTASFINNPWTIVPLYGFCLWFGMKLTGSDLAAPVIDWSELSMTNAYVVLKPYLWPFIAGTLAIGVIAAFVSYFAFYWAVIRYRKTDLR